ERRRDGPARAEGAAWTACKRVGCRNQTGLAPPGARTRARVGRADRVARRRPTTHPTLDPPGRPQGSTAGRNALSARRRPPRRAHPGQEITPALVDQTCENESTAHIP